MGIAGLVLWRIRDRVAPGVLFGLYLMIAGIERFLIEFIRRNEDVVAGLTQAQLIGLGMLALGAGILATRAHRAGAPRRPEHTAERSRRAEGERHGRAGRAVRVE